MMHGQIRNQKFETCKNQPPGNLGDRCQKVWLGYHSWPRDWLSFRACDATTRITCKVHPSTSSFILPRSWTTYRTLRLLLLSPLLFDFLLSPTYSQETCCLPILQCSRSHSFSSLVKDTSYITVAEDLGYPSTAISPTSGPNASLPTPPPTPTCNTDPQTNAPTKDSLTPTQFSRRSSVSSENPA